MDEQQLEDLDRLGKLRERGVLTEAEFAAKKSEILESAQRDRPPEPSQTPPLRSATGTLAEPKRGLSARTVLGVIVLLLIGYAALSSGSKSAEVKTALASPIPVTNRPVALRADQLILPPEQFPIAGYVVRQDEGDSSGGWLRTFTPAGRDDRGIGVAIHVVPSSSDPAAFFNVYSSQRCSVVVASGAISATDGGAPNVAIGDRDRFCVVGYSAGSATLILRSLVGQYVVDVAVSGAVDVTSALQIDRAQTVMRTQVAIIRRIVGG